jgi:Leucine-rich repeat (LRR) protein/GTPase SAR1 family protein
MARDEAYLEAEKKIEETLKSGATRLDLDKMGLNELPDSIGNLTWLESLDLSENRLIGLPDALATLSELRSLYLFSNELSTLPNWLGNFNKLKRLALGGNHLKELPDSLANLKELVYFTIWQNRLASLPDWLKYSSNLEAIDISGNILTDLPEWLQDLKQLTDLSIQNNPLTIIPEWLLQLRRLKSLQLGNHRNKDLPEWLGKFTWLEEIGIQNNLSILPTWLGSLSQLQSLRLAVNNNLTELPAALRDFTQLQYLNIAYNKLKELPDWLGDLDLITLTCKGNNLQNLPTSLVQLEYLEELNLDDNPLNPELAEAYKQGLDTVKAYLRAKSKGEIILDEAKLILVGEGEVGKTCLMDALVNKKWQEHPSTHGIEIQQIKVTDPKTKKEITLNGWDFGGQRVYRPTHQLFFSAPAVYLVVWKPREGPQQGFVKEWIQLIKRREPTAKILVVATHGGPQQRQPDIDRQELWDTFGKDTVVDFFFVDSKPDEDGNRKGIEGLKLAIARTAANLPEVGRSVPKRWQEVREALQQINKAYLPFDDVRELCRNHNMEDEEVRLFITISHRLGHLIYYEHDLALRDVVVLKPDWLATAVSFVLDDKHTRTDHGLISYSRLSQLWDDPKRNEDFRYPPELHPIFLRLMERFDLSYRVAGLQTNDQNDPTSLIAQLVPDIRPEGDLQIAWPHKMASGDIQKVQICKIVDAQSGQSATAEGLFYQLIVRLHKYSLGRVNYNDSVHWQRGLVLDNAYNGRAFLEYKGNDVHIAVRAAYPQGFLTMLTEEVKYLVQNFWEGLRCNVMVPCVVPCGINKPGNGMFEVGSLIESMKEGHPKFPCPTCNKWQDIGILLVNAPAAAKPVTPEVLFAKFAKLEDEIYSIRPALYRQHKEVIGNVAEVRTEIQELFSQTENNLNIMLQALADEAKDGPRLFSLVPIDRDKLDLRNWVTSRFRLTLWCEHSHLPLTALNKDKKIGVHEFDLTRQWVKDYAPLIKAFTITLKSFLPVAFSAAKLAIDTTIYKDIENELDFSKSCIDALISESEGISQLFVEGTMDDETTALPREKMIYAQNATLREFHALLNTVDKKRRYGNLVKVRNKQQKFLWVHEKFAGEY